MAAGKLQLPISLDAMGGDNAPACVLQGAEMALIRHPGIRFLLYGNRYILEPLVEGMPLLKAASEIVHTEGVIAGDDKPSHAVRRGRDSSMWLSIEAVKEHKACAIVSAGNTGALMATFACG